LFSQFEDDPANYLEIELKLRGNLEILQFMQETQA
jgi:hypothetical protein